MKFTNSVPNGYIYTSPTDIEYQKCGSSWVKCSTGSLIESRKVPKLELAAQHQIMECNEFSRFEVGSSYNIGNTIYTYIGSKNFTINGAVLSESTSTSVYEKLTEDDENVESQEVPYGYVYSTPKGNSYRKTKKGWQSTKSENYLNSSASSTLEDTARRKIIQINHGATTPIGWKWKSKKGNEYVYVGNGNFYDKDGRVKVPKHIADQIIATNSYEKNVDDQAAGIKRAVAGEDDGVDLQSDAFEEPTKEQPKQQDSAGKTPEQSEVEPAKEPESKSVQETGSLEDLAKTIKNHPAARKITILLSRGDAVSLLAADILLSGKTKEAVDILNALNKG